MCTAISYETPFFSYTLLKDIFCRLKLDSSEQTSMYSMCCIIMSSANVLVHRGAGYDPMILSPETALTLILLLAISLVRLKN